MKERVGLGKSFDLGVRKITVLKKDVHIYYVNGLVIQVHHSNNGIVN